MLLSAMEAGDWKENGLEVKGEKTCEGQCCKGWQLCACFSCCCYRPRGFVTFREKSCRACAAYTASSVRYGSWRPLKRKGVRGSKRM